MHRFLGRLGSIGVTLGALAVLTQCGGSDLTLPGETGPARITKLEGDNQSGAVGLELPTALKIQVVNQRGTPVANQTIVFVPANEIPGIVLTPGQATTDGDGTATSRWVLGATSGNQQVVARVVGDGVPDGLEATFAAIAGSGQAQQIRLESGNEQHGAVGSTLDAPLTVRVSDQFGNPVPGVEVHWKSGDGSVDPESSTTGPDGLATTSWTLGRSSGFQSASAVSAGLDGSPVTFTSTAGAGTADNLVQVSGDRQSGKPGEELAAPLVIRLVDRNGNGIPQGAVSWVVGVGGGTVSSASSTTGANGEAQTRWTLGSPGNNTLNAVVSGVGFVAFTATATGGGNGGGGGGGGGGGRDTPQPSRLAFTLQPSNTQQDERISPGVQVAVLDQVGRAVTSGDFEIKLELQGDPGKLKGHSSQRTRSGVATFDDLTIGETGTYLLRATSNGLASAESATFEVLERAHDHDGHDHHHHHDKEN